MLSIPQYFLNIIFTKQLPKKGNHYLLSLHTTARLIVRYQTKMSRSIFNGPNNLRCCLLEILNIRDQHTVNLNYV